MERPAASDQAGKAEGAGGRDTNTTNDNAKATRRPFTRSQSTLDTFTDECGTSSVGTPSIEGTGGATDGKTSLLGPTFFTEVTLADGQSPVAKKTTKKKLRPHSCTLSQPKAKVAAKDRASSPEDEMSKSTDDGMMLTETDRLSDNVFASDREDE